MVTLRGENSPHTSLDPSLHAIWECDRWIKPALVNSLSYSRGICLVGIRGDTVERTSSHYASIYTHSVSAYQLTNEKCHRIH